MILCPFRFTTGTRIVVAGFWFHNAHIAFSQADKAWVAVPLRVTLAGFPATGNTIDFSLVGQLDPVSDTIIHFYQRIINR